MKICHIHKSQPVLHLQLLIGNKTIFILSHIMNHNLSILEETGTMIVSCISIMLFSDGLGTESIQPYLDTVMSLDRRVMSMHPSSKSEIEHRSTQTCFVLGFIWIPSTSWPRPPSSSRLQMMTCSQSLSWRPFPVILMCWPRPSTVLNEETRQYVERAIVPDTSKTIHRGCFLRQPSRRLPGPSSVANHKSPHKRNDHQT